MYKKLVIAISMITILCIVPNQGYCEFNVFYEDFSDLSGFTLGSNAADLNIAPDNILQLSSGTWQRSGYAYLVDRIPLETTFSTYFSFRINNNVGGGDSDGLGADWLMFLLKRDVGYFSADDFAIEFDIFNNGSRDNYSGNHVGINYGNQFVTTQHVDQRFNDGEVWHAWIEYDGMNISVFVSLESTKPFTPTIIHAVNISDYFPDVNPLIGFQAASGAYGADFEILNWSFATPMSAPSYSVAGFEPPCEDLTSPVQIKKNKCIPLKTELLDPDGVPITDADITSPPIISILSRTSGDNASDTTTFDGLPPAEATDGIQFEFIGGRWCYNLKIKGFWDIGTGMYQFQIKSGDESEYTIDSANSTVTIFVEK